jgi:hypothetical protein
VAHASGNTDFDGDWTVTDPANGETASLLVSDQKDDGSFSGTLTPPGDAPQSLSAPFSLENARVDGRHFSFTIERSGIGGTGPDDRNATYTANWEGTITGNSATGSIDAKTVPGTVLNPDGFAGQRSFTAHRASSVTTSPALGPVAGGTTVLVVGSGLDSAVSAEITDGDGTILATVPADGATASGFTFKSPDLTAAYHDANNASVAGSSKPISQLVVEVVPLDAQGAILSPPADYTISPPIVTSATPAEVSVGGGQTISVAGKFFEGASAVDFQLANDPTIVSAPVTVDSDSKLEFTVPDLKDFFVAHRTSSQLTLDLYVRINVTQAFGSLIYSNSTPVVVDNLRVDNVSPAEGPLVGGDTVAVTGSGFSNVTEVDMIATGSPTGKAPRTLTIPVSPASDKYFTFTVPDDTAYASGTPASSRYDIVVVATANGQRETSSTSASDIYEYKGPEITSTNVGSNSVSASSGAPITLKGKYFKGVTEVFLSTFGGGNISVTPTTVTDDTVTFTLPDLTKILKALGQKSAKFDVVVEIPAGGSGFNYIRSVTGANAEFTVKS